jgi:hypothetical protein
VVFIDAINVKIRDGQVASRPVKTALISGGPGKYLAVTSDGPAAPPVGGAGSDRSAAPLRSGVPTTARKPDCLPIHIADGLVRAPVRVMAAIWRGSVDPWIRGSVGDGDDFKRVAEPCRQLLLSRQELEDEQEPDSLVSYLVGR